MRVNGHHLTGVTPSGETLDAQRVERGPQPAAERLGPGSDRVELSEMVSRLARALEAGAAERATRVEGLAQLYERGEYRVDALAVSRALLQDSLR